MDPTTEQQVEKLMKQLHEVLVGQPVRVVMLALAPLFQMALARTAHDLTSVDAFVETLRQATRELWQDDHKGQVN